MKKSTPRIRIRISTLEAASGGFRRSLAVHQGKGHLMIVGEDETESVAILRRFRDHDR
jgi:hypothetical protein